MPQAKSRLRNAKRDLDATPAPTATAGTKPVSHAVEKSFSITPAQRYQMIAEAAYYRAEKRGFIGGDAGQDWLEAEAEIDRILQYPAASGKTLPAEEKQAFQQKLETQLQEWDAKLHV